MVSMVCVTHAAAVHPLTALRWWPARSCWRTCGRAWRRCRSAGSGRARSRRRCWRCPPSACGCRAGPPRSAWLPCRRAPSRMMLQMLHPVVFPEPRQVITIVPVRMLLHMHPLSLPRPPSCFDEIACMNLACPLVTSAFLVVQNRTCGGSAGAGPPATRPLRCASSSSRPTDARSCCASLLRSCKQLAATPLSATVRSLRTLSCSAQPGHFCCLPCGRQVAMHSFGAHLAWHGAGGGQLVC